MSHTSLATTATRAQRSHRWTARWAAPLVGLVLSAVVFAAILSIDRSADRHTEGRQLVAEVRLRLVAVQNLPWDADPQSTNFPREAVRAHIASTEVLIARDLRKLGKLAPGQTEPQMLKHQRENARSLYRQLHWVSIERQHDANVMSDQALRSFTKLNGELEALGRHFRSTAVRDSAYSWVGTGALLLGLYAAFLATLVLLRRAQQKAAIAERQRHTDRMASVGQLAGGIAHDFNNLLLAIGGYGSFLLEGVKEKQLRGYAQEIVHATDRAAALTAQLLAFSRRQMMKTQAVDLNASARDVSTMMRSLLPPEVLLELDLDESLAFAETDPGQIGQVVMNLILNARDAVDGSGTITITTRNAVGHVVLSVQDTGAGMDEATRLQVFEPFFTTKPVGSGTGLGLASVYGIVVQSGGEIDVASEPGHGTTFTVRLAASERAPETAGAHAASTDGVLGGSGRVLLVDDEDSVRELLTAVLRRRGYTVIHAASPDEALTINPGHYDLLVTDVVMPGMTGVELAQRLDAPRVLFISGYDREAVGDDTFFLPKPFTEAELAAKVREVLDTPLTTPDTIGVAA
ncbi:MAG: two-component system, cell cycle sensor histidine kinase and response regulator CckA [Gaiellaceae bacterium]|nr:two-component system, cell cycle sensor histidine kinase and response regulator CckA [Gaiellaceae bacterium]